MERLGFVGSAHFMGDLLNFFKSFAQITMLLLLLLRRAVFMASEYVYMHNNMQSLETLFKGLQPAWSADNRSRRREL
jgi:hypothetical protein